MIAMDETQTEQLAREITREFHRRMLEDYVPRIATCVALLTESEVWARPNVHCNSVGNLLRHLEGNVRQWIISGVGGGLDERDRDGEFAATLETEAVKADELVQRLRATVTEAVAIVDALGASDLLTRKQYQSLYDETGIGAVLHVMEHFSGHTGQIIALTKQAKDVDLSFYDL